MNDVDRIWKDKFSVGIKLIDDHHKRLLGIILQLQSSLKKERLNHKVIKDTLNELQSYTKYHFNAEEKLMKQFNYGKIDTHISEHEKFINEINWFAIKYEQNRENIKAEMLSFLKDWLIKHILVTDMGYSSLLKGRVQ